MKKVLSAVVSLSFLLLSIPAFAGYPLSTDDAGTNGKMKFQMETSAEFAFDKQDQVKSTGKSIGLSLSAGLLDSLDISAGVPFTWQKEKESGITNLDNSGLEDTSLALKWRFMELGPASFALKPSVSFATGHYDRGLGAARPGYSATLISSVEFKPATISANAGYTMQKYTVADKDGNREHLFNFSLAAAVEVMKHLQVVAEIGTGKNSDRSNNIWPTFITGGVIYSVLESLEVSLGARGGVNDLATDITAMTALTFKF